MTERARALNLQRLRDDAAELQRRTTRATARTYAPHERPRAIIFIGATGVGKSFMARQRFPLGFWCAALTIARHPCALTAPPPPPPPRRQRSVQVVAGRGRRQQLDRRVRRPRHDRHRRGVRCGAQTRQGAVRRNETAARLVPIPLPGTLAALRPLPHNTHDINQPAHPTSFTTLLMMLNVARRALRTGEVRAIHAPHTGKDVRVHVVRAPERVVRDSSRLDRARVGSSIA